MSGEGCAAPERRLLRRARVTLALQIAAALTLAVAGLGACVYRIVLHEQQTDINNWIHYEIGYGTPGDAKLCEWMFALQDGRIVRPVSAPAGFPLLAPMSSAPADGRAVSSSLSANGTVYSVLTERVGGRVLQVVFDTRYERADLWHVVNALILTEAVGLAAVGLVSAGLARRSISPLGEALARQRRFVADASHELRTPLTRLHTRAQLLLRWQGAELPEQVVGELEQLIRGARELGDVVDDLLLSASLHPDPARRERVDLTALARSVIEAERPRAEQRTLVLDLGGEGGNGSGPASGNGSSSSGNSIVYGIESPLRRMISALVDNAIGHTPPTGRIVLALRPADGGHSVELDVSDNGTGFDPADGARIFERFARGERSDAHRFGLGLALVREVVESHGGTISAHGVPGHGAQFVVRLPAAADLPTDTRTGTGNSTGTGTA